MKNKIKPNYNQGPLERLTRRTLKELEYKAAMELAERALGNRAEHWKNVTKEQVAASVDFLEDDK